MRSHVIVSYSLNKWFYFVELRPESEVKTSKEATDSQQEQGLTHCPVSPHTSDRFNPH